MRALDITVRALLLLALASSFWVCGCDRAAIMRKITPAEDEAFARRTVDLLRQHQFEQIERELDPSISDPNIGDTLARAAGMFPADDPKSVKAVGLKVWRHSGSSTHTLTLEYEFPEQWLLLDISIKRMDGLSEIAGLYVTPISDSLESVNRFSLVGKSALQYAMLVFAVAGPIFSLFVLVVCLRTEKQNLKWLWALFILLGVGRLAVNWTTGEFTFTPLAVYIPCASATAVPAYGPWVVAVYLPLGAILFLIRRSRSVMPSGVQAPPTEQLPPTLSE
jgi:hypothetical protein